MSDLLRRLGAFGRPFDASVYGWRADALFGWITIVIVIVFAIVLAHLAIVIARSKRRSLASLNRGDDRRAGLLVFIGTLVIFLAVDGVALMRGDGDLKGGLLRTPATSERPVPVEVLAQQWAWSFRLAGADGQFGTEDDIVTLHELRLPVGRPAILSLRSKDVIHSLYVPSFRIKRDVQPGVTNTLLLEPTSTGRYEVACAQHCGANHYLMRGTIDVVGEADFERWVASESARQKARSPARPSDANWAWPFEGPR